MGLITKEMLTKIIHNTLLERIYDGKVPDEDIEQFNKEVIEVANDNLLKALNDNLKYYFNIEAREDYSFINDEIKSILEYMPYEVKQRFCIFNERAVEVGFVTEQTGFIGSNTYMIYEIYYITESGKLYKTKEFSIEIKEYIDISFVIGDVKEIDNTDSWNLETYIEYIPEEYKEDFEEA